MLGYWKFKPTEQLEKLEEDTLVIKNQIQGGLNMYYIKDKTSSSPDIEQKASAMFANTLPTNVNAERICVENYADSTANSLLVRHLGAIPH